MERLNRIISDIVFVIQILIAFVLIFENRIELPPALQAFGRVHPLMLHLPIGLLLVTVILLYVRRYFEGEAFDHLVGVLLHFSALTASLSSLMGLFLSFEGTFSSDQLQLHKWLGIALSFLCWGLLAFKHRLSILRPIGLIAVVLLVFTGHYGAALTHGENFVWAPLEDEEPRVTRVITDSTTVFTATVEPILESKCYGCHNNKKAKGNLILTSLESMKKGGKNGPLWKPEDAAHSLIVERLLLPIEDDDHMPPKDKAQLTDDEITFISLWIDSGANTNLKLTELTAEDTLSKLAQAIIPRYQQLQGTEQKYTFKFASPEKIQNLSRPNRSVFQIARNEPAIQADFFLREMYDRKNLDELLDVRDQLVSLNLSKMPVTDDDLKTVAKFSNLENLNLNNTEITGDGLKHLIGLPNLRSLSLSGTRISEEHLRDVASAAKLQEVYIWNTSVSAAEVESLKKDFPGINWSVGFIPDEKEVLKLNVPLVRNKGNVLDPDEKVSLRHNLPGTLVRYTLDGSDPDSLNSPIYRDPLTVGSYATIKTKAFKDGWLSSDVVEFFFFRKGLKPDTATLVNPPDERFAGDGVSTLLDAQKGLQDFYRHPAWMAFKDKDLVLDFAFNKEIPTVRNITLSFAHNSYMICLPPDEMQLWGGNDRQHLQLIAKLDPAPSKRPEKPRIEGVSMDVGPSTFKYYRLVAKPYKKLPEGNPKNRTLWLMVDEVFIN
jgi:hypothetical protein